ncbi:uncharacterized protein LOC119067889 [Bradysia coprophila]|uniref:uncharacterized protein LOC119067889 n=1 Tax=Bradysia coprophila TaxID=38358 RepID=UPI00187D710A|nr:uncharacterized protein LOC119067889 [Bradysia coprophila]
MLRQLNLMAENNLPHVQMVQLDITYRELLVKLKAHVTRLANQMDAMLCVKWIQKLQTLTQADDIKLRNYLLLQICNQISTGYLDHPFINASYLDQDLKVVANCCRECEPICNASDNVFKMPLDRSSSNITDIVSDLYISDVDGTVAIESIFENEKPDWREPKVFFAEPFENVLHAQNFYRKKYEETLADLKEAKLKLYLKSSRSLAEFIDYLGANFIEKYQKATEELMSIEKSSNPRKEFLEFKLNFCSKFKFLCGDLMSANVAENLLQSEDQFQRIQNRILCNGFVESNESKKDLLSTDRATVSTDLDANNTKYSEYLKRYIRKQQKQFNRKIQGYEGQIAALKKEICSRDKKQSRQIIEMKCENIIKNEQKARDQLSESLNDLESKYKNIVQQIFNDLQNQN